MKRKKFIYMYVNSMREVYEYLINLSKAMQDKDPDDKTAKDLRANAIVLLRVLIKRDHAVIGIDEGDLPKVYWIG